MSTGSFVSMLMLLIATVSCLIVFIYSLSFHVVGFWVVMLLLTVGFGYLLVGEIRQTIRHMKNKK